MPAVLHHYGVPLAPALAGTIAYWGLVVIVPPAAAGAVLALGMRHRARGPPRSPLGRLAQLGERRPYKAEVGGSSPSAPTGFIGSSRPPCHVG